MIAEPLASASRDGQVLARGWQRAQQQIKCIGVTLGLDKDDGAAYVSSPGSSNGRRAETVELEAELGQFRP